LCKMKCPNCSGRGIRAEIPGVGYWLCAECVRLWSYLFFERVRHSSTTGSLNKTFHLILILLLCYNFNMMMIILFIYGITLLCINILPFTLDNLYGMLHISLTPVAHWR